jgi:shikimate dehydrogenase
MARRRSKPRSGDCRVSEESMNEAIDTVDYIGGRTRLFGIVGHPIEQVRSPEMFTAEFRRREHDAILVPLHVLPDDFDATLPALMRLHNLDGLVFTIPYKVRACGLASELGVQAQSVGAINALARGSDGRWRGEIFDGLGCVEAFRRRGILLAGMRIAMIGAGGAGAAVGVAIAGQGPRSMRVYDLDPARAEALAGRIRAADPAVDVAVAPPSIEDADVLLNVSPVGMLGDARLPIDVDALPSRLTVFDAVVKPDRTPLIELAAACGCTTVMGREMMRGQVSRMVDFFLAGGQEGA